MTRQLAIQFLRFCAVGSVGFLIDGGLLWLLVSHGMHPLYARMLSFPIAVAATWSLNGNWTFRRPAQASAARQFNLYFITQLLGLACNFSLYIVALWILGTDRMSILLAFAIGSFVALFWNFASARYVLYLRNHSY